MRRLLLAALTAGMLLTLGAPAWAHPGVVLGPTLPTDLTHAATDNVEYLGRFPEHAGTAGGRIGDDGLFYLTDPRGVYVYDISEPESPELLGSIALYQTGTGVALAQEDPDTNGEILLVDAATSPFGTAALQVVDVSDPTDLKLLASVPVTDHTWECVSAGGATGGDEGGDTGDALPGKGKASDQGKANGKGKGNGITVPDAGPDPDPGTTVNSCAYAYGRTGHIVDLTDPANPELLTNSWRTSVGYVPDGNDGTTPYKGNTPYTHDLTEVRAGLVFSAGEDAILMDTSDPANPVRLAAIEARDRFTALGYHSVEWAQDGRDRYVVLGTEISPPPSVGGAGAGSDCQNENSVIETWDASEILAGLEAYDAGASAQDAFAGAQFHKVDEFDAAGRGIFLQGQAPGNVLYCAHWMEPHPDFADGGLLTVSYYDRGTRFVEVAADGTMSEIGWIVPAEGYSGSSQWLSDEVVAIMDYRRGMEIVRVGSEPAEGVNEQSPDAIAVGSRYVPPSALSLEQASAAGAALLGAMLLVTDVRRRRRRAR